MAVEQKEGGGTAGAKLTGLDTVTYREFVLVEAEYNNITHIVTR